MKSRLFLPVPVLLLYAALFVAAHAKTPLETSMKKMSSAYKELNLDLQQPTDADKAHYLQLAGTMKTEAQTSRTLVPKKAGALPADQQATMVKAYQKSMDDLIQGIDALTQDLQNSQWDDARKVMAALKQQMMQGHKDFRVKK